MYGLKRILLAEDSAKDVELTLAALEENNLANEVTVVRDGAETLDYLYHWEIREPRRQQSGGRAFGHQNAEGRRI